MNIMANEPYWLFVSLVFLFLFNLWGGYQLFRRNIRFRFISVDSLNDLQVDQIIPSELYKNRVLPDKGFKDKELIQKYLDILHWTMNKVDKIALKRDSNDPDALLKSVERGEGAICSGMARIYRNALAAVGLQSREINLFKDLLGFDGHSSVEVPLQGKWILLDPTFSVGFKDSSGQFLSAQEIKGLLLKGAYPDIHLVSLFKGNVAYPANLEDYYTNILLFFNNVFVRDYNKGKLFKNLPPWRYWLGPKLYYEKIANEDYGHVKFLDQLYFGFIVVAPVMQMVLFILIIYMNIIK